MGCGLQIGIVCVLLVMWGFFVIGAPRTFLSPQIYAAYMSTIPFFAIMALPLTMVVIAGEMDLSFGSIMAIGMLAFVNVFEKTGNAVLAFVLCLVAGFLVGLLNGIIVVKLGIPSLVATIGTQFFWRGVVLVVTGGHPASLVPVKGTILRQALVGRLAGYVPAQMIWTIVVAMLVWVLLNRHKLGAHVYLVGDNEDSARLMGVNVDRTRMMIKPYISCVQNPVRPMATVPASIAPMMKHPTNVPNMVPVPPKTEVPPRNTDASVRKRYPSPRVTQ